ncbi:N-acetylglucosamine-specific PTS transporter subunit IIBC [Sphingomonas hylomeconis]|uniref:N-acetylglucosamine-specific PTS transporter subunit IIBC n=1 Tax=Sphingomonas hylomeconis TaxID=1395958 RepID=A0ABV7T0N5_9SPHN|nr:N-acetylglucosamine-specific PTS transporter subunit IIBC [Sphingomonas hylomeconis]
MQTIQERLQVLGRALMLPIAVLPVAGIMLRIGQPDLLNLPFVAGAGDAIFAHLGLLFAIGVGVGIAREQHGAAGLAGAVGFLVLIEGAKQLIQLPADALPPGILDEGVRNTLAAAWRDKEMAKLSVPAGILSGIAAGTLYNRYHTLRLPEYLSFFAGRRLVPILSGMVGLVLAAAFGLGYPILKAGVDHLSYGVAQAGPLGLFAYGALNRLLIVTGLHHILNNIAWFVLGDFKGATGDLNRFFAGDPAAGAFMAGFFPVMMFGLPAACLAMWRQARPDRRAAVGGMFLSLGLTSFLTGVTEPIEFTFMFLAPALYVIHALLTGLAMAVLDLLGVRLGFGFSAGLFDYLLNYRLATRPLLLLPIGAVYFALYYFAFSFAIRRFNLQTPGREPVSATPEPIAAPLGIDDRGRAFVEALGGDRNLAEVSACTTRLRLVLHDRAAVNDARLTALGSRGSIAVGERGLQVVVGPAADSIADAIRRAWQRDAAAPPTAAPAIAPTPAPAPDAVDSAVMAALFGGQGNIRSAIPCGSRTIVTVADAARVDMAALDRAYPGRYFRAAAGAYHLLAG